MFRFPLRNIRSKLSNEVYSVERITKLLQCLKDEAELLLLFLRSVQSIEVFVISVTGSLSTLFKVVIESANTHNMTSIGQRVKFFDDVESSFQAGSIAKTLNCTLLFSIAVINDIQLNETSKSQMYVVVHHVGSTDSEVLQCAENSLSVKNHQVIPWVSLAYKVNDVTGNPEGRLFCFLPLPTEEQAPFALHVNATFATSSNRRSVVWVAKERQNDEGRWNGLLVEKCLPSCYVHLLNVLVQMEIHPEIVYKCWPDISKLQHTPWQGMLKPFFTQLLQMSTIFHTPVFGGQWISLKESILVAEDDILTECIEAILCASNIKICKLPSIVWQALDTYLPKVRNAKTVDPTLLRKALRDNHYIYKNLDRSQKLEVLKYCLKDKAYNDLSGLELIPLLDGSFVSFMRQYSYKMHTHVYVCNSAVPYSLLPNINCKLIFLMEEDDDLHSELIKVAESSQTQLKLFGVDEVAELLPLSQTKSWSEDTLKSFWEWLNTTVYNLKPFVGKYIIPVKKDIKARCTLVPLNVQKRVVYISHSQTCPTLLISALYKCGLWLANQDDFPYLYHPHLSKHLYELNPGEVLDAMPQSIISLIKFTNKEAEAMQKFFAYYNYNYSNSERIQILCNIPMFSVLQNSDLHSIKSLKSSYANNRAIGESNKFVCRTDLLTSHPLVLSSTSNESSILRLASQHVELMSETDFLQKVVFNQIQSNEFCQKNLLSLMKSILEHYDSLTEYDDLGCFRTALSHLSFVPNSNRILKPPCELYDPSDQLLQELFMTEPVFPVQSFRNFKYLCVLRECKLKSIQDVTAMEVVNIIQNIHPTSSYQVSISHHSRCIALLKLLNKVPSLLSDFVNGSSLSDFVVQLTRYCSWLPVVTNHPRNYPECIGWAGSSYPLASSADPVVALSGSLRNSLDDLALIAGSKLIFVENVPKEIAPNISCSNKVVINAVLKHFQDVIALENVLGMLKVENIAFQTYQYLRNNCTAEEINYNFSKLEKWVWTGSSFVAPKMVALSQVPSFSFSLEPFLFIVHPKMKIFSELFGSCDVKEQLSTEQIISVLHQIKRFPTKVSSNRAWQIVQRILEWIAEDSSRQNQDDVLIPVNSTPSKYPQLMSIKDVTYTQNKLLLALARSSEKTINLVHSKVHHLAPYLGVKPLSDHLGISDDIFEDAGQCEPLTTRITNILSEYKDGLTIIKELLQNADDAGATEMNIVYDMRYHSTERLLLEGMGDSHGPALLVHNNSIFSDEDFSSITNLASGLKKSDASKIGKFGIGFCSVYHITDVPSFISRDWLYIFDPTLKHLKEVVSDERKPGKKIQFTLEEMVRSTQLAPYEDMFGFLPQISYSGTIFRLPFRKCASQISSTIYTEAMIKQLVDDLKVHGSKLLLFLCHVKSLAFHVIEHNGDMNCILKVKKDKTKQHSCIAVVSTTYSPKLAKSEINREFWAISCHSQQVQVNLKELNAQTLVSAVACLLLSDTNLHFQKVIPLKGEAFCFLPLSMPTTGLPVHVNANFAVMSNRSAIWTSDSESQIDTKDCTWNEMLMTFTIAQAYCNLLLILKSLKESGTLLSYDFATLWPTTNQLGTKEPWDKMVDKLYELATNEELFYSSTSQTWLAFCDCTFLSQDMFCEATLDSQTPSCIIKAIEILKLPVLCLSKQVMEHVSRIHQVNVLTDIAFTKIFLTEIKSFESNTAIRNDVLYYILQSLALQLSKTEYSFKDSELHSLLNSNACIPCVPNGESLKPAYRLVAPNEPLNQLFDLEDEIFPINRLSNNAAIMETLKSLGLISECLPWEMIIERAQSIQSTYQTNKQESLCRVQLIIKCIKQNMDHIEHQPDHTISKQLCSVPFLPVACKPSYYPLPWEGDKQTQLLSPIKLVNGEIEMTLGKQSKRRKYPNNFYLVGSQKPIVNNLSVEMGGCGKIPDAVCELLSLERNPNVMVVMKHYVCLIEQFTSSQTQETNSLEWINEICQLIYSYLDHELYNSEKNTSSSEEFISTLELRKDKPFVWTGEEFVPPIKVAAQTLCQGPFLHKIPDMLSEKKHLQTVVGIKEEFDIDDYLKTFEDMFHTQTKGKPDKVCHSLIETIINELNGKQIDDLRKYKDAYLPNKTFVFEPVRYLAYDDNPLLLVKEKSYIHPRFRKEVALALGVAPVRSVFLESYRLNKPSKTLYHGIPFGQKEELTQRIKNILEGYTLDITLLKELLQNADDARASKMCVILDKRQHTHENLPTSKWSELQGPALLIWNDANFTDDDLRGIQDLGSGTKRDNRDTIGQYGIGFNVVYHITDCPSFLTRGNVLCVLDPHCHYVAETEDDIISPGWCFNNLDDSFWKGMSGLSSCYLQDVIHRSDLPIKLESGTLFRFPLRCTTEQVEQSKLADPISDTEMQTYLETWVPQIKDALLFLNSVRQFQYFVIENGECSSFDMQLKACYSVHLDKGGARCRKEMRSYINRFPECKRAAIKNYTVTVQCNENAYETSEKWLIQQGVGDYSDDSHKWYFSDRITPKHGIAVPLLKSVDFCSKVFCFLPLPIISHLPVHINGQFILNADRRSLWKGEPNDPKREWNESLIQALSSSYAIFLKNLIPYCTHVEYTRIQDIFADTKRYYSLFPYWKPQSSSKDDSHSKPTPDGVWRDLAESTFHRLWTKNSAVLSSVGHEKGKPFFIQWNVLHCDDDDLLKQAFFEPNKRLLTSHLHNENTVQLKDYLLSLGMKLTCAPYHICKHLKQFSPAIADKERIFKFYVKFCEKNIHIPCPVQKTPFKTAERFSEFVSYLLNQTADDDLCFYEFPKEPFDLPFLITADNVLKYLEKDNKVLRSKFSHLFPNNLDEFLHPAMLPLLLSNEYFPNSSSIEFCDFSALLRNNFPKQLYGVDPVPLDEVEITIDWLKEIWSCISSDEVFAIHCEDIVKEWVILPASNGMLYSSSSDIVPMFQSNMDVVKATMVALKDMGIPVLMENISVRAQECCPTIADHRIILKNLYHMSQSNNIFANPENEAEVLFKYFGKLNFRSDEDSLYYIKAMPLWETLSGIFTTAAYKRLLLWPSNFCREGIDIWAPESDIIFLTSEGVWKHLCEDISVLGGETLSEVEMYSTLIFQTFWKLSPANRGSHLSYIMNHMHKHIIHTAGNCGICEKSHVCQDGQFLSELKDLPCVEAEGELIPIHRFCDDTVPIFEVFKWRFHFLPNEYRSQSWLKSFRILGIKKSLSLNDFKVLCNDLCTEIHVDICEASQALLDYVFSDTAEEWHNDQYVLQQIGSICFAPVQQLSSLNCIVPHCEADMERDNIGLTKLKDSVSMVAPNPFLIWTMKPIVQIPCESLVHHKMLHCLGVTTYPDPDDVYANVLKISQSWLADFNLFSTYTPPHSHPINGEVVIDVMLKNLDFLCGSRSYTNLQMLCNENVACIPVSAEDSSTSTNMNLPVLVHSMQVVRQFDPGDRHLFPYIHKLPSKLSRIGDEALKALGVSQSIEPKHIQKMLETMHKYTLDVNSLCKVRYALLKLYSIYASDSCVPTIDSLYLPTKDNKLCYSSSLVFIDSQRYMHAANFHLSRAEYSLFVIPLIMQDHDTDIYFKQKITEKDLCLRLPVSVRPYALSVNCREMVRNETEGTDKYNVALHLKRLQAMGLLISAILPNIINKHLEDNDHYEEFVSYLLKIIMHLNVRPIKDLEAKVYMLLCNPPVSIGVMKADYILHKEKAIEGSEQPYSYILYITSDLDPSLSLWYELARSLCIQVAKNQMLLFDKSTYLKLAKPVAHCLSIKSEQDLKLVLNMYNMNTDLECPNIESMFIPQIGQVIPDHVEMQKDENNLFHSNDWVGFLHKDGQIRFAKVMVCEITGEYASQSIYRILIDTDEEDGILVPASEIFKLTMTEQDDEPIETLYPNPEEAKRWLRQAKSDYHAMNVVYIAELPCQACFLAHETIEKALKAGCYALFGLHSGSLTVHHLHGLACDIVNHKPKPIGADILTTCARSIEEHYLNSRFPNRCYKMKAPVDIYRMNRAEGAVKCAEQVLEVVEIIVQNITN